MKVYYTNKHHIQYSVMLWFQSHFHALRVHETVHMAERQLIGVHPEVQTHDLVSMCVHSTLLSHHNAQYDLQI